MTCLLLIFTLINITTSFILSSNSQYRTNIVNTELYTIVSMEETEQLQTSESQLASSILMDALQSIEDQKQRPTVIQQAINILNNLESQANSFSIEEPILFIEQRNSFCDCSFLFSEGNLHPSDVSCSKLVERGSE